MRPNAVRSATPTIYPSALEASEPPEARGLTRDAVRMFVSYPGMVRSCPVTSSSFPVPGSRRPLVINTSGTLPAAIDATADDGTELVIHLSTQLAGTDGSRTTADVGRRPIGGRSTAIGTSG